MTSQEILPISIIVPTLNEEKLLGGLLTSLQEHNGLEIIVTDGGSTDRTLEIAENAKVEIVHSRPGRGFQQNAGAEAASYDTFVFLHCDTRPPHNFPKTINEILNEPETVAGAFRLKIDTDSIACRLIEWGANVRSSLFKMPYGDQAIFTRKEIFKRVGGFPDQPFLEDLELVRRLKRAGRIRIARSYVSTSERRWQRLGPFRTTLLNQIILIAYTCGASPVKLQRLYYRSNQ